MNVSGTVSDRFSPNMVRDVQEVNNVAIVNKLREFVLLKNMNSIIDKKEDELLFCESNIKRLEQMLLYIEAHKKETKGLDYFLLGRAKHLMKGVCEHILKAQKENDISIQEGFHNTMVSFKIIYLKNSVEDVFKRIFNLCCDLDPKFIGSLKFPESMIQKK